MFEGIEFDGTDFYVVCNPNMKEVAENFIKFALIEFPHLFFTIKEEENLDHKMLVLLDEKFNCLRTFRLSNMVVH